jgi:hypothetical protein
LIRAGAGIPALLSSPSGLPLLALDELATEFLLGREAIVGTAAKREVVERHGAARARRAPGGARAKWLRATRQVLARADARQSEHEICQGVSAKIVKEFGSPHMFVGALSSPSRMTMPALALKSWRWRWAWARPRRWAPIAAGVQLEGTVGAAIAAATDFTDPNPSISTTTERANAVALFDPAAGWSSLPS